MKYLIYTGPGIGDFIMILPLVKAIKMNDPNAYVRLFSRSSRQKAALPRQMLSIQHYIDDIDYYSISEPIHSFKMLLSSMIRKYDYGIVIQYSYGKDTSLIPSMITNLCSYHTIGPNFKEKKCIIFDTYFNINYEERMSAIFNKILEILHYTTTTLEGLIDLVELKKRLPINYKFNKLPIIAFCVGTASLSMRINGKVMTGWPKSWPYENWIQLANRLAQKGYEIILLGGKKERNDLNRMQMLCLSNNVLDYTGKCSITESMALLSLAQIIVGADTGLMHCAAALNKPTLSLFGCTDYKQFLPFGEKSHYIISYEPCYPCYRTPLSIICETHNCMRHITVEQVYNKIIELQIQ